MKKSFLILVAFLTLCTLFALSAPAQDSIYISEPTVVDMAKVLPRYDAALWNMDFRDNPALLSLDCPYEFIGDFYYLGGYRHISTSAYGQLHFPTFIGIPFSSRATEMDYYAHGLGGDFGFTLKLNDRTNLGAIFGYRWDHVSGDGAVSDVWERPGILGADGFFDGSRQDDYNAHTFGVALLMSHALDEKTSLGVGLKYSYTFTKLESDMGGFGERFGIGGAGTETASTEDELKLGYHRIAPILGASLKPSPTFTLDASVEAGFYFGTVQKDATYAEDFTIPLRPPTTLYSEDLDSLNLSGWDLAVKVNPEFTLSDRLSVPIMVAFNYRDFRWEVGGVSDGDFIPWNYLEVSLEGGQIEYENAKTGWDISAGAGVKYRADWGTLSGLAAYIHRDTRNTYGFDDQVDPPDDFVAYNQRDNETRDILSLGVVLEKELSPTLTADLGMRYDLGWGHREIRTALASFLETNPTPPSTLIVEADGRDIYQDLTLTTHLTIKPVDHFSIALGGMVKIPLDTLDYGMDGASSGLGALSPTAPRPGLFFDGPFSMGYESRGWDWGGLLSATYEFGCPTALPPVEPVIEPKIEPMSMK